MAEPETLRLTDGSTNDSSAPIPPEDEEILKELRADYDYDVENWAAIREQAAIDVDYASNNTWTKDDEAKRGGRPMLNLDQLSQYRNQIENNVRMNKRGVKVSQAGGGATKETAELRANRIREIEYQSHAQEAYSQAFSDCLTRSYGFARIVAEYEDEDSDNQVFRTKAIPNPDQVVPDSDGQSTSGRDWKRCFYLDTMSHAQFRRDFPDAKIRDFDPDVLLKAGKWITQTRVQVAECWRLHETPNPKGYGRPKREICMYLTNGVELLAKAGQPKKHPWKGKYIPFAACYGRIVYKTAASGDQEKLMLSYHRFARDAAKGYNWTASTELEALALPVKASLFAYEGQMSQDNVDLVERSTREPIPLILAKATMEETGQQILPLPQYGTRAPDIQGYEIARESFRRDIQNALGHYNASSSRQGSTKVTSGVAIQELKESGDLGSYDFLDHYDDFLKFMGEQYDDLLGHYDDASKEIATRLPDDTVKMETINTPSTRAQDGSLVFGDKDLRMDQGRHTITISTGPSNDSQREAGKEAALTLLGNPAAFPVVAADCMRLLDLGPIGDQMAKDLEYIQPPAMQQARAAEQEQNGKPDPRQQQLQISQLTEQLQHAEGVMKEMDQQIKTKAAEQESKNAVSLQEMASKERIAAADREAQADLALALQVMKDATTIASAHIAAMAKGAPIDAHAAEEAAALGRREDREHEYVMHAEKLASAERLAMRALEAKRQTARKLQITRGEDGSLQSATIQGDAMDDGMGAPA